MYTSTQVQQSTPATRDQIAEALKVLFNSMRFPPGVDRQTAIFGYMNALEGFTVEAITYGIRRFLKGECKDVNPKYCPHPPELATIIRDGIPERKHVPGGKLYGYSRPHSKIVAGKCTKEYGAYLVRNRAIPAGSIWCPGPIDDHPEIGDVYGPDPNWRGAWPLKRDDEPEQVSITRDDAATRIRMGFKMQVLSAGMAIGKVHMVAEANKRGLEDMIALGQQWGVPVPEELWFQLKSAA